MAGHAAAGRSQRACPNGPAHACAQVCTYAYRGGGQDISQGLAIARTKADSHGGYRAGVGVRAAPRETLTSFCVPTRHTVAAMRL